MIDLTDISAALVGKTVPVPLSGTLSGHAAGEPFDKLVYALIKQKLPQNTYRQYEYLNELYAKNSSKLTHEERTTLIGSKSLQYLLNRGKSSTSAWSLERLFEEKQNDTADIIITGEDYYQLVDVKTVNTGKMAQPPNIISALKVANMCRLMLLHSEFDTHDIIYFEVQWKLSGNELQCVNSCWRNLFKADPASLYINWAAALQIQFHVSALKQDYHGTKEAWCREFLKIFVKQARARIEKMERDFVREFEPLTQ
ncbi:MAG: HincII family type II restriction endonuclease [Candidatus Saccharimonadales bacterium]